MLNNCFYKYKNKEFLFASDSKSKTNSNSIIIFRSLEDAKLYSKLQNYSLGVMSNNPNVISFWVNKKIDYIINPFDFRSKGFDKNVFSILKQNNILPVILLGKLFLDDKDKQIQIFKHLIAFNKLCKKFKIPLIILHNDVDLTLATYRLLGYNSKQSERFLGEFNEKEN
jgi:RNase P/RNase MRP subunit p30